MQVFDDAPTLLTTILFNTPAPLFTVLVVLVLMLENELVLNLLFNAANVDSVAAPVGSGKDAEAGTGEIGIVLKDATG